MLTYVLFALGFIILIKGADWLVDGSTSIAKKFNISNIVIGLTIVAFGTSAPELVVNLFASVQGNTDIAIGNILGSNIANILLILGISAIIYPLTTKRNTVIKEIPFSLLAAILVGIMANDWLIDRMPISALTRVDGLVLISFFIIFLYYIIGIAKSSFDSQEESEVKEYGKLKSAIMVIAGLAALMVGGKWIVDGAVALATSFGLSQSLIGLTIVAVGTSLPELAASAVAAYKKRTDIAVGNVIGSNIFNIFWVLGLSAVISPLPFKSGMDFDVIMVIVATIILFLTMFIGKRHVIERWQGALMVITYAAYVALLIYRQ